MYAPIIALRKRKAYYQILRVIIKDKMSPSEKNNIIERTEPKVIEELCCKKIDEAIEIAEDIDVESIMNENKSEIQ